eukprot:m.12657 g.12657  ORF g.12657 m.12657 type:complete len:392 (+) comp5849_c0_seq2:131-1306(+)
MEMNPEQLARAQQMMRDNPDMVRAAMAQMKATPPDVLRAQMIQAGMPAHMTSMVHQVQAMSTDDLMAAQEMAARQATPSRSSPSYPTSATASVSSSQPKPRPSASTKSVPPESTSTTASAAVNTPSSPSSPASTTTSTSAAASSSTPNSNFYGDPRMAKLTADIASEQPQFLKEAARHMMNMTDEELEVQAKAVGVDVQQLKLARDRAQLIETMDDDQLSSMAKQAAAMHADAKTVATPTSASTSTSTSTPAPTTAPTPASTSSTTTSGASTATQSTGPAKRSVPATPQDMMKDPEMMKMGMDMLRSTDPEQLAAMAQSMGVSLSAEQASTMKEKLGSMSESQLQTMMSVSQKLQGVSQLFKRAFDIFFGTRRAVAITTAIIALWLHFMFA